MKILLEIYNILKNIKYIKRNTIAFHEYYDLYKILMKIKNVAVAFLVLTTKKKNKKSSYVNNLVVIRPLEHEKSYRPPHTNNLCCYHALGTRKKLQTPHANNLVVITSLEHEKKFGVKKKLERKKIWH